MNLFENLETAYSDKNNNELNRAYFLFKTINSDIVTRILIRLLNIALILKLPITYIIKKTVFNHFCGGISINDCERTIIKLSKFNIGTILDYSVENQKKEKDFRECIKAILQSIQYANNKDYIPYSVFKFTGIANSKILMNLNNANIKELSNNIEIVKIIKNIDRICKEAYESKTPVFVDAEESWIQNTIDAITLEMMKKYNTNEVIVYNTVQSYRKDRINYLYNILRSSKENNFKLGLKLVRGAYHNQEIERAEKMKYECPVYKEKNKTDDDYNKALRICINNLDHVSICLGTHNEKSILYALDLMQKNGINKDDKRVSFSQLYGMSDHITYNLAKKGYNTTKYVPYGPVKEVIPYLIRRAEENTSITGQIGRELLNISKERNRRKKI